MIRYIDSNIPDFEQNFRKITEGRVSPQDLKQTLKYNISDDNYCIVIKDSKKNELLFATKDYDLNLWLFNDYYLNVESQNKRRITLFIESINNELDELDKEVSGWKLTREVVKFVGEYLYSLIYTGYKRSSDFGSFLDELELTNQELKDELNNTWSSHIDYLNKTFNSRGYSSYIIADFD